MKILHIITSLKEGGAEGVLHRLVCHDFKNNHCVISLTGGGKYKPLLIANNIKVYNLNLKKTSFNLVAILKIRKILKQFNPDIIQTWLYHADFFGSIAGWHFKKSKIIWNIRNSQIKTYSFTTKIIFYFLKHFARIIPSMIISCSKEAMRYHISCGYPQDKMKFIPNGIDTRLFKPSRPQVITERQFPVYPPLKIGVIARYHPQKDHENLLKALSQLKISEKEVRCFFIGRGCDKKNKILVQKIKHFGLEKIIVLCGSAANILHFCKKIDLHILSSSFGEAFPNSVAETMACGIPNIVTNVGDSGLIVGKSGWINEAKNPSALAASIQNALDEYKTKKWKKRKIISRKRIIKMFNLKKMIEKYNKVWLDVKKTKI